MGWTITKYFKMVKEDLTRYKKTELVKFATIIGAIDGVVNYVLFGGVIQAYMANMAGSGVANEKMATMMSENTWVFDWLVFKPLELANWIVGKFGLSYGFDMAGNEVYPMSIALYSAVLLAASVLVGAATYGGIALIITKFIPKR